LHHAPAATARWWTPVAVAVTPAGLNGVPETVGRIALGRPGHSPAAATMPIA
jgi:hypothetical protein